MFEESKIQKIRAYLDRTDGRVYIGCDSVVRRRFNIKTREHETWARYAVVLVVHINNRHGCKIFSYSDFERVYDKRKSRPTLRLMAEVYKSVECYLELADVLVARDVEIHLDVNPNEEHGSNSVVKQAVGYVKGLTSLDAVIKPDAWAGSTTADFLVRRWA